MLVCCSVHSYVVLLLCVDKAIEDSSAARDWSHWDDVGAEQGTQTQTLGKGVSVFVLCEESDTCLEVLGYLFPSTLVRRWLGLTA
jgi:hypothetical protein